ncbi:TetR/AcrR family transcriptional regulator [Solicola gregarius]|uniref:TetR/AcrR family transcriptional regulator n=1 Tax=Solicola gregarius TaxID=2908642 RepID=A0AA46YKM6_9ACTN|nr:TetR/AcrR family transcriptional regulator [Solicola gregarius]UYM04646.1 TetR/AcrR family transcriptional regulator [Solicola gregarius]
MAKTMRADARRNRDAILVAARDLVVERGSGVPLDEVARAAGVGIGTLYRHFPERTSMLHEVAVDALTKTRDAANRAMEDEDDAFDALARYLREALELRVSAVMPALLESLDPDDAALKDVRDESAQLVESLIDAAKKEGGLAPDLSFADVATMLVRIARPLPGPLGSEVNDELSRRHLELFIRGLRADPGPDAGELPGVGLDRAGLRESSADE